jgi:hypothetical protein
MINIENIILFCLLILVLCVYFFVFKQNTVNIKEIICPKHNQISLNDNSTNFNDKKINKLNNKTNSTENFSSQQMKTRTGDNYIIENFFNSDGSDQPMPVGAYPLHPNIDVDIHNYEGNISNYMLRNVNDALEKSKAQLNKNVKDTIFNYKNNPIGMIEINSIEFRKIAEYIIKVVNDNLLQYESVEILNVINILNITAGSQMKKEFNMICSYKLGYGKSKPDSQKNIKYGNNNLIINTSIVSTLTDGDKELYVEKLLLEDLTSDPYLPGNNYLEDYYSYNRPLSTKYVRSDAETIAEEYLLDNPISEDFSFENDTNTINTDEISSLFS